MNALGGPASATTGHGVFFEEAKGDDNYPAYCYTQYDPDQVTGTWNNNVPEYSLVFHLQTSGGFRTTLGWFNKGAPDNNHMVVGTAEVASGQWDMIQPSVAHEVSYLRQPHTVIDDL
jgi:hypothetical protein